MVGPVTSIPGPPPDQLAPAFSAFEGLAADDGNHGMCGNLTVASLAQVPLPAEFAAGGSAECADELAPVELIRVPHSLAPRCALPER